MPSTREPLFLPDPDSPLFQETFDFSRDTPANVSNLQEPEDQSEPKASLGLNLKSRREVYVLLPRRVHRTSVIEPTPSPAPVASMEEAVEGFCANLQSNVWREEDKSTIMELKKSLFAIAITFSRLTR